MATSTTTKTATTKTATAKTTTPKSTASVTKSGDTVTGRFTLKNLPSFEISEASKPLFAVVGVADLAIEQAKDVPADLTAQVSKVQARLADVPARVKTIPEQLERANQKATDLYAKLSVRGERLVTQIRRQPATQATLAEGKEAVRKAEASAVAAKKTAQAGEKAVESAAGKIG
jgi:hypothetical protein